jgi:hypothetical protein
MGVGFQAILPDQGGGVIIDGSGSHIYDKLLSILHSRKGSIAFEEGAI